MPIGLPFLAIRGAMVALTARVRVRGGAVNGGMKQLTTCLLLIAMNRMESGKKKTKVEGENESGVRREMEREKKRVERARQNIK